MQETILKLSCVLRNAALTSQMLYRSVIGIIKGPPLVSAVDAAYFACFRVRRTSSQPQVGDEIAPERIFKGFWVSVLFTNFSAHLARSEINNRAM